MQRMTTEKATFGAGCFWGVESTFRSIQGVTDAAVGYAGGTTRIRLTRMSAPMTGHAEVVQVEFDPSIVSYEKLLDVFWANHDPTTLNRQGPMSADNIVLSFFTIHPNSGPQPKHRKWRWKKAEGFARPIVTQIDRRRNSIAPKNIISVISKSGADRIARSNATLRTLTAAVISSEDEPRNHPRQKFRAGSGPVPPAAGPRALAGRGPFRIALSGGNTPQPVYLNLPESRKSCLGKGFISLLAMNAVFRPMTRQSNFRMAKESFFRAAPSGDSIERMRAKSIRSWPRRNMRTSSICWQPARRSRIYRHDLILLWLGRGRTHALRFFPGRKRSKKKRKESSRILFRN